MIELKLRGYADGDGENYAALLLIKWTGTPRLVEGGGWGFAQIGSFSEEVREWCDANLDGPVIIADRSTGYDATREEPFLQSKLTFVSERDAVLFKMFWL